MGILSTGDFIVEVFLTLVFLENNILHHRHIIPQEYFKKAFLVGNS
jgi:hypothetical protein